MQTCNLFTLSIDITYDHTDDSESVIHCDKTLSVSLISPNTVYHVTHLCVSRDLVEEDKDGGKLEKDKSENT